MGFVKVFVDLIALKARKSHYSPSILASVSEVKFIDCTVGKISRYSSLAALLQNSFMVISISFCHSEEQRYLSRKEVNVEKGVSVKGNNKIIKHKTIISLIKQFCNDGVLM